MQRLVLPCIYKVANVDKALLTKTIRNELSKTTSKPRPSFMHMTSVHSLPSRTPASFDVDWMSSCWEM